MGVVTAESVFEAIPKDKPRFKVGFSNKEYSVSVDERDARFELKISASGIDWRYYMLKGVRVLINRRHISPAITMYYSGGTPIEAGSEEWLSITEYFDMQSQDAQDLDQKMKRLMEEVEHLRREKKDKKDDKELPEKIANLNRRISELDSEAGRIAEVTETKEVVVKTGVFAAIAVHGLKTDARPRLDQSTLDSLYPPARAGVYQIDASVECIVCKIGGPTPTRYPANKITLKVEAEDKDSENVEK